MKNLFFIALFGALTIISTAEATTPLPSFNLRLMVWSRANSDTEMVGAPKNLYGDQHLMISGEANYTVVSENILKLRFLKPIAVEIKKDGVVVTVLISTMNVKTDAKVIAGLQNLLGAETTVLYSNFGSHHIPLEKVIEAGTTSSSIIPILQSGIVPELIRFNGTIYLSGRFDVSQFLEQQDLEGSLDASVNDVNDYDSEENIIYIDDRSSSSFRIASLAQNSGSNIKAHELQDSETLALLKGIINLKQVRKNMTGSILSFTDENGQKMVGVVPPKGDSNVVQLPFGKVSCNDLLKNPKDSDFP